MYVCVCMHALCMQNFDDAQALYEDLMVRDPYRLEVSLHSRVGCTSAACGAPPSATGCMLQSLAHVNAPSFCTLPTAVNPCSVLDVLPAPCLPGTTAAPV